MGKSAIIALAHLAGSLHKSPSVVKVLTYLSFSRSNFFFSPSLFHYLKSLFYIVVYLLFFHAILIPLEIMAFNIYILPRVFETVLEMMSSLDHRASPSSIRLRV